MAMRILCSHSPSLVVLTLLAFLLAIGQTRNSQGSPRGWPGSSYGRVETRQKNYPEPYNNYYMGGRDDDNRQGYDESDEDTMEQQPLQTWRIQHEQRRFQPDERKEFNLQSSVEYVPVNNWPALSDINLGQISAVTFDNAGNVVLFQRGDHEWDATTFNATDNYLKIDQGPIKTNTLITYDADTGKVLHQWGAELFYMPHGITIDANGYIFLTDVALHQVFKFPPQGGDGKPLLVLGTRWENGNDRNHFCKPSAVAVTNGGDFFVADGYCNHRIVKFDKNGEYLMKIGQRTWPNMQMIHPPPYSFSVPHALAMAEEKNIICVADRENGRIQCFHINNGTYVGQIALREFGHRLFSIAYTPVQGGLIYAVNGPDLFGKNLAVQGFVIGIASQQLVATFAPQSGTFSNPHDLAVSYDSNEVYVVELNPHRVWKFVNKNAVNSTIQRVEIKSSESFTREPTIEVGVTEAVHQKLPMIEESPHYLPQSVEALIVVAALVSISMLAIIFVLIKKRGPCCYWFRYKKWQYKRGHTETFKLGNLLDPTAGFQLVGQEMSDEEEIDDESGTESTTKRSFNNSYIANA